MPLAYQGILETLDPETQDAVTSAYIELCKLAAEQMDQMRHLIARRLLVLAQNGERDSKVLKEKAGALITNTTNSSGG